MKLNTKNLTHFLLIVCLATLFGGNGVHSVTNYFVRIGTWATV